MSYHSNCNVTLCRFFIRNKLNIPLYTFSFKVFFFSENKNPFRNLRGQICANTIYVRTCLGQLWKLQVFSRGFLLQLLHYYSIITGRELISVFNAFAFFLFSER